jgi:hypothetical protein
MSTVGDWYERSVSNGGCAAVKFTSHGVRLNSLKEALS